MGEGKKHEIILGSNQATESSVETAWKRKKVYDSMVSSGWVSSQNYLAALYTAASGFTGSGSFSEGSPRHAISLLSFPWITAHYNTTIGLVQILAMQQCSGFFFLSQNYSPLYFSRTILLEKLYSEEFGRIMVQALHNKYWIKHWILNIFKSNFTMNNRGLTILFYIHRVLAQ